jgi:uncharacterized membrane protein
MNQTKISYKRHIAKTISYRIISTGIGFLTMWWISGSFKIGAAFGIAELLYKPIQYYLHERIWYKWIKFGVIVNQENKEKIISELTENKIKPELIKSIKPVEKKILSYNSIR